MERKKLTDNYFLDEFVDPHTYLNEPDSGLSKIDIRVVGCVQLLRRLYNKPIQVNNWWSYYFANMNQKDAAKIISEIENGSLSKWSGYRSVRCTIGAPQSAHKLGKAADPKGNEKELMAIVENNAAEFYKLGLRRLEDIRITKGWLHMDVLDRNTLPDQINVVDLKSVVRRIKTL